MQKSRITNYWNWIGGIAALFAAAFTTLAVDPYYYAVQVSASVSTSPAKITLNWQADSAATGFTISRKNFGATSWTQVGTAAAGATTWSDSNVSVGGAYEYSIIKSTSGGYTGTGYLYAGIQAPLTDTRGKVLLVVDKTYASQLTAELTRFQQDLIGDGWTVVRRDVNRSDSVTSVKNVIKSEYNNGGLRSVILFGHVAVPYSGSLNPDGHPDHVGAWPADVFYGDMDGNWTDSSVNNTSASKSWNWNTPGDGKFDQSTIPSDVELEVGRIDLSNMTCFSNKTPSRSELDLLRQYLNKDHNFRHGLVNVSRRGVVCDNFGVPYGEAFAAAGWRLSAAYFGAQNASAIPGNQFFTTLTSSNALFAYGCGGGSFYTCAGIGSSDDYALNDVKAVFTLYLGSYFADWDNESNYLRAPLGGSSYTLTSGWSGRPEWWLHHMGLGETIGYGTKLTQNNQNTYSPQYQGTRGVHIALHGDPTLRLHPVLPVANLTGSTVGSTVTLTWAPSADTAIQGYHIYRATSANGPFTRVTSSPISNVSYTDTSAPAGAVYMVRAVKLETSGSGTYYNASQGMFYTSGSTGGGSNPTPPIAPSNAAATSLSSSQIKVSWSDNSSDESGFRIERKTGAAGTYTTVTTTASNAVSFTDTGLNQGTLYFYRISAGNNVGLSTSIETSATTASATVPVTASATFVTTDATAQGTWKGVYGADGATIMGDTANLPGYVSVTPAGNSSWTWNPSTADTRALQKISGTDRIASAWYLDGAFTVDLNFTDGAPHRTALYFLDWDNSGRVQTVEILDAASGAVLNTQTVSAFSNGKYLIWDLKGAVRVRLTKVTGFNAELSGIFFGPVTAQSGGGSINTTTASKNGSAANVRITGSAGQSFKIYSTSDFATWTNEATVTLTGTTYDYADANPNATGKFYKAVPQ